MTVVVFCMFFTSQEINTKLSPNTAKLFVDFLDQKTSSGLEKHLGVLQGERNPPGHAWTSRRTLVGRAPLGAPPRRSQGPLHSFWSIKNLPGVSLHLDSVCY